MAKRTVLKLNPVNGISEIITVPPTEPEPAPFELQEIHEPEALPFMQAYERAPAVRPLAGGCWRSRYGPTWCHELGIGEALADAALARPSTRTPCLAHSDREQGGVARRAFRASLELASGRSVGQVGAILARR